MRRKRPKITEIGQFHTDTYQKNRKLKNSRCRKDIRKNIVLPINFILQSLKSYPVGRRTFVVKIAQNMHFLRSLYPLDACSVLKRILAFWHVWASVTWFSMHQMLSWCTVLNGRTLVVTPKQFDTRILKNVYFISCQNRLRSRFFQVEKSPLYVYTCSWRGREVIHSST